MEDYKKGYEQWLIEGQRETFDIMSLDEQGRESMEALIKEDGLAERVWKNTFELYLGDDELNKVKKLYNDRYHLIEDFYKKLEGIHNGIATAINPHLEGIQPKTNEITQEFFSHHGEQIRKIMLESVIRASKENLTDNE